MRLPLLSLAVVLDLGGASAGQARVLAEVRLHRLLPLGHLLPAGLRKLGLRKVLLQAPHHAPPPWFDLGAEHGHFLGTELLQLGAQAYVACSQQRQLQLLPAAVRLQLLAVLSQARQRTPLPRLHLLAILRNVLAAGFCQQDVVAEVRHLHLLEVDNFVGTGVGLDVLQLLGEAPQRFTAARRCSGIDACIGAQSCHIMLAGLLQPEVQPVICSLALVLLLNLQPTHASHHWVIQVLLQAADDACMPVRHLAAQHRDLVGAGPLERVKEVDVFGHLLLLIEQRRLALEAQLVAVLLEAPNDAR
mmetsp:Transcript_13911/g.41985  ORF Transcript_13911/g.41985 Transcript_13911/m.41985 type:complete len:303 (+) Transcript_13911:2227-3135(+)